MNKPFSFLNFVKDYDPLVIDHLAECLRRGATEPECVTLWSDEENPAYVILSGKKGGWTSVECTFPAEFITDSSHLAELELEADRYREESR